MDSNAGLDSKHQITFTATADPTISTTVTFTTKEKDAVVITAVQGTSSKKLFTFSGGGLTTIAQNASYPLSEGQLSATVFTDINQISSEELINTVAVTFTLPEGFAFSKDGNQSRSITATIPPETTADSFIFTLPSSIDIIAAERTAAEKKNVTIKVLDRKTGDLITSTSLEGCFVSTEALTRIAGIELIGKPSLIQTYPAEQAGSVITLPEFAFSCKLLSWYDLAEIPKEEQPEYPLNYSPLSLKLRFENIASDTNGFVRADGTYALEKDIQAHITQTSNTMLTFEFLDLSPNWKDFRLKVKPYTGADTVRLVYTEEGEPDKEQYATGRLIIKSE